MPPLKYNESLMLYSVNCKLFPSNLIFPFLGFEKHHIESAQNTVETKIDKEGMYFQPNIHIQRTIKLFTSMTSIPILFSCLAQIYFSKTRQKTKMM